MEFDTKSELKHHMIQTHGMRIFSCDECENFFKRAFNLKQHKERIHQNVKNFYCQKCSYAAYSKGKRSNLPSANQSIWFYQMRRFDWFNKWVAMSYDKYEPLLQRFLTYIWWVIHLKSRTNAKTVAASTEAKATWPNTATYATRLTNRYNVTRVEWNSWWKFRSDNTVLQWRTLQLVLSGTLMDIFQKIMIQIR